MLDLVDVSLVKPGDIIPGLGRVMSRSEVGQGTWRRVHLFIDDSFTLIAKVGAKVTVERA